MSQISQTPPPISHSDHCHLSFISNHLHLINTQLSEHYLSTPHLSQLSDLAYTKWTLLNTVTYLKIAYLLFLVGPPCLLRLPVFVRHPSSSSVLVRGVCSTTSSMSSWQENHHQYILYLSKYFKILSHHSPLLTRLLNLNKHVLFHILCVWFTSRNNKRVRKKIVDHFKTTFLIVKISKALQIS